MFQFPGLASLAGRRVVTPVGLPHSEIRGSTVACTSPRLIAACHVLHRLSAPRHPPCALTTLGQIQFFNQSRPTSKYAYCARSALQTHVVKQLPTRADARADRCCSPGIGGSSGRPVSAFGPKTYSRLQKGGDPAAGSPTATLLRLRPSYRACLRPLPPCGWDTDFGHSRLPWRDGRCVQGPGTYSPRRS
jgi:hypothetical protein